MGGTAYTRCWDMDDESAGKWPASSDVSHNKSVARSSGRDRSGAERAATSAIPDPVACVHFLKYSPHFLPSQKKKNLAAQKSTVDQSRDLAISVLSLIVGQLKSVDRI
jgi:hypothetical protein